MRRIYIPVAGIPAVPPLPLLLWRGVEGRAPQGQEESGIEGLGEVIG